MTTTSQVQPLPVLHCVLQYAILVCNAFDRPSPSMAPYENPLIPSRRRLTFSMPMLGVKVGEREGTDSITLPAHAKGAQERGESRAKNVVCCLKGSRSSLNIFKSPLRRPMAVPWSKFRKRFSHFRFVSRCCLDTVSSSHVRGSQSARVS